MNASSGPSSSISSDSSASPASAASSAALLPPSRQRRLANDLAKIVAFVGTPPPGGPQAELIEHVDFPRFVAGLIEGLLKAMVHGEDASDHHMRAYAQLVEAVSRSVEEFQQAHVSEAGGPSEGERPHRDFLTNKYPEFVGAKAITPATKRALVADILLMGIDRVVAGAPRATKVTARTAGKRAAAKPAPKVKAKAKAGKAGKKTAKVAKPAPKRAAGKTSARKGAGAKPRPRR